MLTGPELGAAIEAARKLKKITKRALAEHFEVAPPSIQDWVNRGTIDKAKLPKLWAFFSDVVEPEHWGLTAYPFSATQQENMPANAATGPGVSAGAAVGLLAAGLAALPASRRKTIAQLTATQITDGVNRDEIEQIDALTPGVLLASPSAWRSAAFGLAEKHPDPDERERLTAFIRAVDAFLTEAPVGNSVTTDTEKIRHSHG